MTEFFPPGYWVSQTGRAKDEWGRGPEVDPRAGQLGRLPYRRTIGPWTRYLLLGGSVISGLAIQDHFCQLHHREPLGFYIVWHCKIWSPIDMTLVLVHTEGRAGAKSQGHVVLGLPDQHNRSQWVWSTQSLVEVGKHQIIRAFVDHGKNFRIYLFIWIYLETILLCDCVIKRLSE